MPFECEYEILLLPRLPPITIFPISTKTRRPRPSTPPAPPACPRASISAIASSCCMPWPSAAVLGMSPTQGRLHRDDVYMPITPMFHVHAWGLPYTATVAGMKQVYPGRYAPDMLLKLSKTRKRHLLALRADHPAHAAGRSRQADVDLTGRTWSSSAVPPCPRASPKRRSSAASTCSPAMACRKPVPS